MYKMFRILLLSFLWVSNGNNISLFRLPPLLNMRSLTWVPANLSHPLDNDTLIIIYLNEINTLLATHWSSPTINVNFGTSFSGYIYYKGPILGKYLQEHLPNNSSGRILYGSHLDEYCIAVGMDDKKLRKIPGYDGRRLAAACPVCYSIFCPQTHQPCSCGWVPVKQERSQWVPISEIIGITWW